MEVIRLENMAQYRDDVVMPSDIFLLQVCNGVDESAVGTCAELIFAPIDASFSDDAPLLPSGFRIIPLESKSVCLFPLASRTLSLCCSFSFHANPISADWSCRMPQALTVRWTLRPLWKSGPQGAERAATQ